MADQVTSDRAVRELKATAHLMLLDPGVFCVVNVPGSGQPDPGTGLPGVRLSPAPAPGPFQGRVTLSGFNGDGWLSGKEDAALVRVSGGPAQVLVTVYQSAEGAGPAPKLQVIRLTGPAPASAAPAAPPAPVEVTAHIYGRGDVAGRFGEWVGERGSRRWIEGFGLQPLRLVPPPEIEYQAVLGRGWLSPWSEGGQFCGSRGMSLPILGLRARLRGASAQTHSLTVSATFVDGTAIGPVSDGQACEAPSLAALEAFQVTLQPKPAAAAARRVAKPPPPAKPAGKPGGGKR